MTEELPPTLLRLLDDLPTGNAPVTRLLTEGASRRRRRHWTVVGAAAATVAIVVGGVAVGQVVGGDRDDGDTPVATGSDSPSQSTDAATEGTVRDVPTNGWRPGEGALQALITGTLELDRRGCLVLQHSTGKPTRVSWPADYTAVVDTDGRTHLRDSTGTIVASVGDEISAGGGYGLDRSTHPCLRGTGPVAAVQSELTVTDPAESYPMPELPEPTGESDDAAYQKWLGREPLPDCGEQWINPGLQLSGTDKDLAYAECLRAGAENAAGGEAVVHFSTVEGDPITDYLRVLPDGSVEIYTDSTLDAFGSGRWDRRSCADLENALDRIC